MLILLVLFELHQLVKGKRAHAALVLRQLVLEEPVAAQHRIVDVSALAQVTLKVKLAVVLALMVPEAVHAQQHLVADGTLQAAPVGLVVVLAVLLQRLLLREALAAHFAHPRAVVGVSGHVALHVLGVLGAPAANRAHALAALHVQKHVRFQAGAQVVSLAASFAHELLVRRVHHQVPLHVHAFCKLLAANFAVVWLVGRFLGRPASPPLFRPSESTHHRHWRSVVPAPGIKGVGEILR